MTQKDMNRLLTTRPNDKKMDDRAVYALDALRGMSPTVDEYERIESAVIACRDAGVEAQRCFEEVRSALAISRPYSNRLRMPEVMRGYIEWTYGVDYPLQQPPSRDTVNYAGWQYEEIIIDYIRSRKDGAIARGNLARKFGHNGLAIVKILCAKGVLRETVRVNTEGKNPNVYYSITPDGERVSAATEFCQKQAAKMPKTRVK